MLYENKEMNAKVKEQTRYFGREFITRNCDIMENILSISGLLEFIYKVASFPLCYHNFVD
jgi:hypothetical protein